MVLHDFHKFIKTMTKPIKPDLSQMVHAHQIRNLKSYLGSETHVRLSNNNNPSNLLADTRVHNDFK